MLTGSRVLSCLEALSLIRTHTGNSVPPSQVLMTDRLVAYYKTPQSRYIAEDLLTLTEAVPKRLS